MIRGETGGGATPVVVLLHGQPGAAEEWQPVLTYLDGLEVVVRDRPGYDGTPPGGFFTGGPAAVALVPEGRRAVFVGHSWGAGVALAAALAAPERTAGLVLVTPVGSPLAVSWVDRLVARRLPGALFANVSRVLAPHTVRLAARAMGSELSADTRRYLKVQARRRDMRAAWSSWRVEQRALVVETSALAARIGAITAPAIVLGGRRDTSVSPRAAADLARRLPRGQYRAVDAGHLLPLERPDVVAAAIRDLV